MGTVLKRLFFNFLDKNTKAFTKSNWGYSIQPMNNFMKDLALVVKKGAREKGESCLGRKAEPY